jgi:hypothetical protein
VAWACVTNEAYSPVWEAENEDLLSDFTLKAKYFPHALPVLGVSKTSLSFNAHAFQKETSTTMNVETAGSFYTFIFKYPRTTGATNITYMGDTYNVSYDVQNKLTESTTVLASYIWSDGMEIDTNYSGVAMCAFFLPMQQQIKWITTDSRGNTVNSNLFSFRVAANQHISIEIDTETGVTNFIPAGKSSLPLSPVYKQSFDVGKMKATPVMIDECQSAPFVLGNSYL